MWPHFDADEINAVQAVLRSGKGADLLMVDVAIDIRELVKRLDAEHIHAPIVACGGTLASENRNDDRQASPRVPAPSHCPELVSYFSICVPLPS